MRNATTTKSSLTVLATCLAILPGGAAVADEVDAANMTTFVPGTPAIAAEVNGNFTEITTQVNDNAGRIAALEAQIAALTGANIDITSMNGTYVMVTLNVGGFAGDFNHAKQFFAREKGLLSFNGDGTCLLTLTDAVDVELNLTNQGVPDGIDGNDWFLTGTFEEFSDLGSEACTYVIDGSGTLAITWTDGFTDVVHMTPSLATGTGSFNDTGTAPGGIWRDVGLFLMVKQTALLP